VNDGEGLGEIRLEDGDEPELGEIKGRFQLLADALAAVGKGASAQGGAKLGLGHVPSAKLRLAHLDGGCFCVLA
jgi:hypothetical protein